MDAPTTQEASSILLDMALFERSLWGISALLWSGPPADRQTFQKKRIAKDKAGVSNLPEKLDDAIC